MAYTDYGGVEQIIQQQFGTLASAFNDVLGTTITPQSHSSSPFSTSCGAIITDEHFRTPEMEELEDQQPEVPAPRPGFRERWASKIKLTPWNKQRSTGTAAEKRKAQTKQSSKTLPSSTNREVVTGHMVFAKVQKDEIPEVRLSFFPHIPVDRAFWRVLLGLDGTGDLEEQVRIPFICVNKVAYLVRQGCN